MLKNPEEVKKIEEEINSEVLNDGEVSIETIRANLSRESLRNVDYLSSVIKESLRISPTIYGKIQVPQKDFEVEGFKVKQGTKIFPCSGVHGMSNAVWKEPTKFIPERFDDTSEMSLTPSGEKRQALATLTFG